MLYDISTQKKSKKKHLLLYLDEVLNIIDEPIFAKVQNWHF